jgi:pimeloyl-ACP methyl ester carboxylesterase
VESEYAAEAAQRWGDTRAYAQSTARTAKYSADDWAAINQAWQEITTAFIRAMEQGEPPNGDVAVALAERHRLHIAKWFYDCPPAMHAGLGRLYVDDPRFAADATRAGLASYMAAAFAANATNER